MPRMFKPTDELGKMVRRVMTERGITQVQMAKDIGIDCGGLGGVIAEGCGTQRWQRIVDYLRLNEVEFKRLFEERCERARKGLGPITNKEMSLPDWEMRVTPRMLRKIANLTDTMPGASITFRTLVSLIEDIDKIGPPF